MDPIFNIQPPYGMDPAAPYTINLILSPMPFKVVIWTITIASYYITKAILRKKSSHSTIRSAILSTATAVLIATAFNAVRADTMLAAYAFRAYETYSTHPDSQTAFASLHPNNDFLLRIKPLIKGTYRIDTDGMDRGTAQRYSQVTALILAPLRQNPASRQIILFNAKPFYDANTGVLRHGTHLTAGYTTKVKYDQNRMLIEDTNAK